MIGFLLGTAAAALSIAGYNSMAPRSQLYGRTFIGQGPPSRQLALTYDDGPNDPYTLRLLDVLAKHSVRATFFLIGRFVQQRPDLAREIAATGHVIGNHTFSHPNLIFTSSDQTRMQLQQCERALAEAVGQHSRLFRPPYGARTPRVLRTARACNLEPVMWNITGCDWNATSIAHIENKIIPHVRGGDVILLHDGSHTRMGADRAFSVAATDRLIARYKDEGYSFVTVPEMMDKKTMADG